MFKKLKEKINLWTKKIIEKKKEEPKKETKKETKKKAPTPKKIKEKVSPNEETEEEVPSEEETKKKTKKGVSLKKETKEKKGFIKKIKEKISKTKISEEDFEEYQEELEITLLENNTALEVTEKIIDELKKRLVEKEIEKKALEEEIKKELEKILDEILIESEDIIEKIKTKQDKPFVILFCGINGSGKTTTIAKLGSLLKKNNISCIFAAADTFRAASIEQLNEHGKNLDIKIISKDYGADPASVGYEAIQYAKKHKINCVLIDTAGRMHTASNLMREIEKISRVCNPDLKIFVGESITGNDVIEQAKTFDEFISLDGVILTKADIDEKGGAILSIGYILKKPIFFLGTGQEYHSLEKFKKKDIIKKLLNE